MRWSGFGSFVVKDIPSRRFYSPKRKEYVVSKGVKKTMSADALPKQQKMLMESGLLILPFFRQKQSPLLEPAKQSSLNYFASAWCALENMLLAATVEGVGTVFHIPVSDEAAKIKAIVGAPEDYEFICLLTMGYPAKNAFLPRQKGIDIEQRILTNVW